MQMKSAVVMDAALQLVPHRIRYSCTLQPGAALV